MENFKTNGHWFDKQDQAIVTLFHIVLTSIKLLQYFMNPDQITDLHDTIETREIARNY